MLPFANAMMPIVGAMPFANAMPAIAANVRRESPLLIALGANAPYQQVSPLEQDGGLPFELAT